MWRSYAQVFFRNLRHQKVIAFINILGLALGLCAFLVIGIYVRDEYSSESRWQRADRIVRLVNTLSMPEREISFANVSELAAPRLAQYFPDAVEKAARNNLIASSVRANGEVFRQGLFHVDADFIDIFDFEVVEGDLREVVSGPGRVALSEETASRLFGGQRAMGQMLSWEIPGTGEVDYQVAAIYRVPAGKGSLDFPDFALWQESDQPNQAAENWFGGVRSYFLLRQGINPEALAPRLDDFVNQQVQLPFPVPEGGKPADVFRYRFQNVQDMYFNPNTDETGGSQTAVNAFGLIAVLVLVISWSNFIILALARSVERQREVGIRKTAGATGDYLLTQFIGEALLLAFLALVIALVLLEFALPIFEGLMQTTLDFDLTEAITLSSLAILLVVTGSIGGIYPALVLARQKPEVVLKPGGHTGSPGNGLLRKLLVSVQFLIATVLIIATAVLYFQMSWLRQQDPGFDAANVVTLDLKDVINPSEVDALRDALVAIPGVERVALTSHEAATPGNLLIRGLRRNAEADIVDATTFQVDYEFFDIYAIDVLAGRGYSRDLDAASQAAMAASPNPRLPVRNDGRIMLNEAAIRALGFASPGEAVGATIEERQSGRDSVTYQPLEIIGVVADNQFGSLRAVPGPEAYELQSLASWYFTVQVDETAMSGISQRLRETWQTLRPYTEAGIGFAATHVQRAFLKELNEGRLLSAFAALAIMVACMGLYGLVAFETRRRTREIGIRNVLGGAFRNIVAVFLAQFARPVFWTNAIAWPLALWVMLRWLERFPYRIDTWWLLPICIGAGVLVIGIVALTVGITVAKGVGQKPALALRHE